VLVPPLAELLHAFGWSPEHPAMREAAPVAARGHNLVYAAPPSPAWAAPVLAGICSRPGGSRPLIGLVPEAGLDEWTRIAARLGRAAGVRVVGAQTPARGKRALESGTELLFLSPETAYLLVRRSALPLADIPGFLLVWPEQWADTTQAGELLHDAGREAQRAIVTADPTASAAFIERYCWKAPLVDLLASPDGLASSARLVASAWNRRLEVMRDLVEQLDPTTLTVWAADLGDRDAILESTGSTGVAVRVTNEVPADRGLIVAYDLPTPGLATELAGMGDLILLVPPGAGSFPSRLATTRRSLPVSRSLDTALAEVAAARGAVLEIAERGPATGSFLAVAPLLERYDAMTVSAALYELWARHRVDQAAAAPAPAPSRPGGPGGKIWLGIGKKDGVGPNDIVAAVIKTAGVGRESVGKVEIREGFSLVELRGVDPAGVAEKLAGAVIRKKRVVARVDRGRSR
jgi:hypothetical protein